MQSIQEQTGGNIPVHGKDTDVFQDSLNRRVQVVEEVLKRYLPEESGEQKTVLQAMNYSMLAGGKRIRPVLLLETFDLYGGKDRKLAEPFAAALEMIHTHSLVHDDLPALDDDRYRRGRETTHVVYGEAMAVLAGDALLNYAYETALLALRNSDEDLRAAADALTLLAEKTGIRGMLGGQCVDVENDGAEISERQLEFIYSLKTGALLEAPLMIGARLAGAPREDLAALERIGHQTGLAFQIQDDILDATGDEKLLGKPVHSDEKNHKTTWVSLYGAEHARKTVRELTESALRELEGLHFAAEADTGFLQKMLLRLASRKQ